MRETASATCTASVCGRARHPPADDLDGALGGCGKSIQWYRQRRLTASCRSRVRFEVSTMIGGWVATIVPISGIVTRGLGQQLEQERLEVVVGAVDLVDQQHRRTRAGVLERLQQRPPDQVLRPEQIVLARASVRSASASRMLSSWRG